LVIEDVTDRDGVIVVRAGTAGGPVPCPRCGGLTGQVHGYCGRTVADVPADGRPVVVHVRVRRMRCPDLDCPVQTFREQVPGVLDRYQRRTARLAGQAGEAVRRLAGRAGAGLLAALGIPLSRHTALRLLLRLPLPEVAVPRVLGVDDFALRRGQVYATILTGAQTGQRAGVLAGRKAHVLETWLRSHPGVEVVCRDGSGAYGEAVRRVRRGPRRRHNSRLGPGRQSPCPGGWPARQRTSRPTGLARSPPGGGLHVDQQRAVGMAAPEGELIDAQHCRCVLRGGVG
jgi:transposase